MTAKGWTTSGEQEVDYSWLALKSLRGSRAANNGFPQPLSAGCFGSSCGSSRRRGFRPRYSGSAGAHPEGLVDR